MARARSKTSAAIDRMYQRDEAYHKKHHLGDFGCCPLPHSVQEAAAAVRHAMLKGQQVTPPEPAALLKLDNSRFEGRWKLAHSDAPAFRVIGFTSEGDV